MADFLVRWDIHIEAATPEEAARKALELQRNPENPATCFTVISEHGVEYPVDGADVPAPAIDPEAYPPPCTNPGGHQWSVGYDDEDHEVPIRCVYCGADGDA